MRGVCSRSGQLSSIVGDYFSNLGESETVEWVLGGAGSRDVSIVRVGMRAADGQLLREFVMGDDVQFEFDVLAQSGARNVEFGYLVHFEDGTPILDIRSRHSSPNVLLREGLQRVRAQVSGLSLYPGLYSLSAWVSEGGVKDLDWVEHCLNFRVLPVQGPNGDLRLNHNWGKYFVASAWSLKSLRFGADRPARRDGTPMISMRSVYRALMPYKLRCFISIGRRLFYSALSVPCFWITSKREILYRGQKVRLVYHPFNCGWSRSANNRKVG